MPEPRIHLTEDTRPENSKLLTACAKRVAGQFATVFADSVNCPACLADGPAVERANARVRAFRRGLYAARLNCKGKAELHAHAGEDVSHIAPGFRCGLAHVGDCRHEGDAFDAATFDAL